MKKLALILAFLMLFTLCACKRLPDTEEYVEPIDRPTPSVQPEKEQQTPIDTQEQPESAPAPEPQPEDVKNEQVVEAEQTEQNTPYDYSQKIDYFGDGHDFWNGESEGATLVSASAPQNNITMSMYIPQGWCYETVDLPSEQGDTLQTGFGIYFWPEGEEKGKIYVSYRTDKWELGCGTGIDFNDIRLGGFDATVVTYVLNDINPFMWNHISVLNKTNSVEIWAGDAYLWWYKYYDTAIKIMSSLKVDENPCSVYDAIAAVEQYTGKIGEFNAGGNYYFYGNYWIIFGKTERYKVTIADPLIVEPIIK